MLVMLKDGSMYRREEKSTKGTPLNPLTREEVAQKFAACVEGRLSAANAQTAIEQVFNLESVEDITSLMNMFTFLK
jgi:2-methylcitrate dehydratase PrpD